MKQLVFMIAATLVGTLGVYVVSPFCGVYVYYLFAVLRPQFMWEWSLPAGVNWSLYVALATIGAAVAGFRSALAEGSDTQNAEHAGHRLCGAHWAMFAFGVWILLTCLTAHNIEVAWIWFVEYLKIFVMYGVSALLICSVRQVWRLAVMIALVLGYIAYEINYKYFVNNYLGIYHNGYGGLDNNGAGLMLAMGVPLCWFAYEGISRWWRWFFLVLIPVITHAVLMTYSRGAMLSIIVACPVLWWRSRQKVRLSIFLACMVMVAVPVMAGKEIRARFVSIQDSEVDASINSRKASWQAAWEIAKDYPFLGIGVRNANLFSYQYGADMEGRTIHSQYLQILADNGFPGLGLYLLLIVTAFVSINRSRRLAARRNDPEARIIAACASGIETSLFLFGFGAAFLSLEVFELPYLLFLLAAQLQVVTMGTSENVMHAEAATSEAIAYIGAAEEALAT